MPEAADAQLDAAVTGDEKAHSVEHSGVVPRVIAGDGEDLQ